MNWDDIVARLNDLPATFTRQGPNFTAFETSLVNGLHKFTNSTDGAVTQAQPTQAIGKWLDVVGNLRNIPRYAGEQDEIYFQRIKFILTTPGGPPNAIEGMLQIQGFLASIVTEDFTKCSWSVNIPSGLKPATFAQLNNGLNYVRPAGVPYQIFIASGGLYLNTLNYLGRPRTTGSYLVSSLINQPLDISTNTNNAINLLPTTFLTDPTLNPSLA